MFKLSLLTASIVIGASILTGCDDAKTPGAAAPKAAKPAVTTPAKDTEIEVRAPLTLFSGQWSLPDGLPSPIGVKPFIQLIEIESDNPNEIRLAGFNGCNRLFGSAIHTEQSLTFSDISVTEKLCKNSLMQEQEATLLNSLNNTQSFSISDNELTLLDKDQKALQSFSAL